MAPSSVRQIGTVAKYELLKYLRGRRLLAIVLLIIIINAIFLIVPPAIGSDYQKDPKEFVLNMLGFLGILSILTATFFGADAIVSEFESKTGYFLFPNPIRKAAIFAGKFVASALVSVGVIALYYAIILASVQVIDGSIPANMGLSFAYALIYLFAILAVSYLFSAIMRASVYSLILTFFTFFLILPIVDGVGTVAKFKPWFSITFARNIAIYILQTPYPADQTFTTTTGPQAAGGAGQTLSLAQYYPDVRLSLLVMGVYFIVALILSIILTRRRQM